MPRTDRLVRSGLGDRTLRGRAVVYAVTVLHNPGPGRDPKEGPYAVAIIALAEGVRMPSNVVGVAPGEVAVGTPVRVVWHALPDGRKLPMFTPRPSADGEGAR